MVCLKVSLCYSRATVPRESFGASHPRWQMHLGSPAGLSRVPGFVSEGTKDQGRRVEPHFQETCNGKRMTHNKFPPFLRCKRLRSLGSFWAPLSPSRPTRFFNRQLHVHGPRYSPCRGPRPPVPLAVSLCRDLVSTLTHGRMLDWPLTASKT